MAVMIDPSEEVTEKPEVPRFELYYEGKPLGVWGFSLVEMLELGCEVMRLNPTWMHVRVHHDGKRTMDGVWRNPLEGRLIKSKVDG
jgi:hypothetical protein